MLLGVACLLFTGADLGSAAVVNFETAPLHPVALSPDGHTLAVCNLPDARVEIFDVTSGVPASIGDIPVGVDPVTVRFRTTNELWVVNHISSSVSIVDLAGRRVVATVNTLAGPADVAFAGSPVRAFVSCAKENTVQVFDPVTRRAVTNLIIEGDRPKALAVSLDGSRVYVAVFESGNASTILAGRLVAPDVVGTNFTGDHTVITDPRGPYGGQNPPPNFGSSINPALVMDPLVSEPALYTNQLPDSIIVKKNAAGRWMDDNNGDWTEFVSGTNAVEAGRPVGWDMPDRDVAIIDTASFGITYATGLMNICMDLAVNPASGKIAVIGTDATNERRFEPNLRGRFLRVNLALVDPVTLGKAVHDLNPHLDYSTGSVPVAVRDLSLGDPRGIVWNAAGTRAYVTGMGSRNLIVLDDHGERVAVQPVELGEGPSGLALDEARGRLYVMNRFSASMSVVDTATLTVVTNVTFFDPTPAVIKAGRKHLYDTRRNSGLGQVSCASCHVDARFDRLAWDLGDPAGPTIIPGTFSSGVFHPMKGPMVTQTFQDIIGHEPLHWRADRAGIENFGNTFFALLGADAPLATNEMQEFKDFLATIHFPPNRFRNFDNSLRTDLPLPGLLGAGVFDDGTVSTGNAVRGKVLFTGRCTTCHIEESGRGTGGDDILVQRGSGGRRFKVAQLRSLPDKIGMDRTDSSSRAGFGFSFDGRFDSLMRFLQPLDLAFSLSQDNADLVAFLLSFSGNGVGQNLFPVSKDAPAGLGRQTTLNAPGSNAFVTAMIRLANHLANEVDLVAHGVQTGLNRGWFYERATGLFQSDRNGEEITTDGLLALAGPQTELTFTLVPQGSGRRRGIDRDGDDYFNRTELESGLDPANAASHGGNVRPQITAVPAFRVHVGMLVSNVFTETDADAPGQTVALSLSREVPAGSSFDALTGRFMWVPSADQADRIWSIGVRAIDNGAPSLDDLTVMEVTVVTPRLGPPQLSVDFNPYYGAVMTCQAVPGKRYQLQYKEHLDDAEWVNTGSFADGYASEIVLYDYHYYPSQAQRFYRVLVFD